MLNHRKPLYLTSDDRQRDRWVFSYTDIVTILLILFVSLAAQTLHARKAIAEAPAIEHIAKPKPPSDLVRIQEALKKHGIQQVIEARGLVITLPQAILFSSGEDRISTSALPIIEHIADAIRETGNKVQLVGHADAVPIHNRRFGNNWELSAARSLQLLRLLTTDYGIDESRMEVISHGSLDPRDSNDTHGGRAENRRVEIVIVENVPATSASAALPGN